jgi:hypothetical protein
MRNRSLTALALVGIAALLAAVPAPLAAGDDFETTVGRVRSIFEKPHFSREEVTQALGEALDAALLVLPASDHAAEVRSRVETVRKMFADGALFEDKIRQYLGLAYKMVADGKAWEITAELKSAYREADIMAQAKRSCGALLDSSLAEHKAGRDEGAVRDLLSFVIFVVTPVQA